MEGVAMLIPLVLYAIVAFVWFVAVAATVETGGWNSTQDRFWARLGLLAPVWPIVLVVLVVVGTRNMWRAADWRRKP
jgi:hypothetical protein